MAFCINCGKSIADGTKYCPACGASQEGTTHCNQRRTVYEGEIHKCPNCGEIINAFTPNCPSCGHEIRETQNSKTVREFSQMLSTFNSKEQIITAVKSFPIPNAKEDIMEFIILAASNIDPNQFYSFLDMNEKTDEKAVAYAWFAKLEQAYEKAEICVTDARDLATIKKLVKLRNQNNLSYDYLLKG